MRKIEQCLAHAWNNGIAAHISNSAVLVDERGVYLTLFGNVIAYRNNNQEVFFTLAGWSTTTTRSRLSNVLGLRIYQRKHAPFYESQEIEAGKWYPVIPNGTNGFVYALPIAPYINS